MDIRASDELENNSIATKNICIINGPTNGPIYPTSTTIVTKEAGLHVNLAGKKQRTWKRHTKAEKEGGLNDGYHANNVQLMVGHKHHLDKGT